MTIGITDARWLLWSTPTPSASTEIEPHPRLRDIRSLEAPSIQQDHLNRNNPEIADSNELFQNNETLTVAPNRTEVGKCCRSRPGSASAARRSLSSWPYNRSPPKAVCTSIIIVRASEIGASRAAVLFSRNLQSQDGGTTRRNRRPQVTSRILDHLPANSTI